MVNSPLIRPAIYWGGGTLDPHDAKNPRLNPKIGVNVPEQGIPKGFFQGHSMLNGVKITWPSRLTGFELLGDSIFSRENKPCQLFCFQGPLAM